MKRFMIDDSGHLYTTNCGLAHFGNPIPDPSGEAGWG
jgi:hypothetical protein